MTEQSLAFRLLGPVSVEVDARNMKVAAPRQRALLAMLLLDVNRTVTASALIDGIWGDAPPQHPESALHIVVCRLRQALGAAAAALVRDSAGYRIDVPPDALDLTRAHAHALVARRHLDDAEAGRAAAEFDAALACWSGEPLADVTMFPFYQRAAPRLQELQIGMVESRNAAYLRCGRHLELLADIDAWIAANPWRERLRAHQMVALYRSGRQIEALAAYDDLRRLLVNDFGVDPHQDIQRLHARILQRDPTLLAYRKHQERREIVLTANESQGWFAMAAQRRN